MRAVALPETGAACRRCARAASRGMEPGATPVVSPARATRRGQRPGLASPARAPSRHPVQLSSRLPAVRGTIDLLTSHGGLTRRPGSARDVRLKTCPISAAPEPRPAAGDAPMQLFVVVLAGQAARRPSGAPRPASCLLGSPRTGWCARSTRPPMRRRMCM